MYYAYFKSKIRYMDKFLSPLRYPGGKGKLSKYISDLLNINNLDGATFYELFAGGAGVSMNLLSHGIVDNVVLNDLNDFVYQFWSQILTNTEEFIALIENTKINLVSWMHYKDVYESPKNRSNIELAFCFFFLNRCNRSGIANAGPIGGLNQNGNYKIDVRFNKRNLIKRIEKIRALDDKIRLSNCDAKKIIDDNQFDEYGFIFLDPPYFKQGESLYDSFYNLAQHRELAYSLCKLDSCNWLLTYDDVMEIIELYQNKEIYKIRMSHTLQHKKKIDELLIFNKALRNPKSITIGGKNVQLSEFVS